jgi:hypothetical protein
MCDLLPPQLLRDQAPDILPFLNRRLRHTGHRMCVIRANPATDSDAIRPPVPTEVGRPFRRNPATRSDRMRPPR